MTCAAGYAVTNDSSGLAKWRAGQAESSFTPAVRKLAAAAQLSGIDSGVGAPGLFGPQGVLKTLYRHLCQSAHGAPGFTSGDIWRSNGPVWVYDGFLQFWIDFCDTVAACYVLLKVGYPMLRLPRVARPLFAAASPRWHALGTPAEMAFFKPPRKSVANT
jgi:hypothetical protein